MSSTENCFRTAAFGGFHKQDVMDYITAVNKEHQEQTAQLKQQMEQARQERAEMAEKCGSAEEAQKKDAAERERLNVELIRCTAALERAERELSELKAEHHKASVRLAELEKRQPGLEADAAAYAALKDRTATIEMEAHRKAQETVDQAEAQAAKLRGDLEDWLSRVNSGYQRMRADITATVAHLTGELERGKTALDDAGIALQQHDETLNELLQCGQSTSGVQPSELLPTEEEDDNG